MSIPTQPSVKTVDKFGIAARGSHGQGPILQPKVKRKFRVLFLGFGADGNTAEPLTLNTNSCGLPSLKQSTKEIYSYNSVAYYGGRAEWQPISIKFRDTVDNSVMKQIGSQLQRQQDHYNQTSYRAAQDYKFTTIIQLLDGGFDTANLGWTLEGCFITDATFGDLDFSSDDALNIDISIRYDNAICEDETGVNSIFSAIGDDPLGTFINS